MIITDKEQLTSNVIEAVYNKNEINDIINELERELFSSAITGIGLAAPQIGINKAVAIVRIPTQYGGDNCNIDLVNPCIVNAADLILFEEGCLSFPGDRAKTIRYKDITIETLIDYNSISNNTNNYRYNNNNPNNLSSILEKRQISLYGLPAIVAQHETSHLCNLTMFNFAPNKIGRNEPCPCGESEAKNKRCHNYTHFNSNLKKLFNPQYKNKI